MNYEDFDQDAEGEEVEIWQYVAQRDSKPQHRGHAEAARDADPHHPDESAALQGDSSVEKRAGESPVAGERNSLKSLTMDHHETFQVLMPNKYSPPKPKPGEKRKKGKSRVRLQQAAKGQKRADAELLKESSRPG